MTAYFNQIIMKLQGKVDWLLGDMFNLVNVFETNLSLLYTRHQIIPEPLSCLWISHLNRWVADAKVESDWQQLTAREWIFVYSLNVYSDKISIKFSRIYTDVSGATFVSVLRILSILSARESFIEFSFSFGDVHKRKIKIWFLFFQNPFPMALIWINYWRKSR
jgi:hypothetical protein